MPALEISFLALKGTALVFSIVELGLVAYLVWGFGQTYSVRSYIYGYGYTYDTVKGTVPSVIAFLMFDAVWTVLVSAAVLVVPILFHWRNATGHNNWLAPTLIVVYFVTLVFWLAGFADLATILGPGVNYGSHVDAVLAFAILLWLIFLALFILSLLAIFGVVQGTWPGYLPMRKRNHTTTTDTTTTAAPAVASDPVTGEPKYENGHELTV